jgi:calcineurin-like phosphoesterase family protein
MSTFFWSDLHIGHVKLATEWRPFYGGTVESHNASIADRWNDIVGDGDRVIVVGDACMGHRDVSIPFFASLNGEKWLVPGNHEKFHPSNVMSPEKREAAKAAFTDAGVYVVPNLVIPGDTFGLPDTIVSHFPWRGTPDHSPERDLIDDYGPERESYGPETVLIHGHTHSKTIMTYGERQIHVGVDAFPAGPVSLIEMQRCVELARERS